MRVLSLFLSALLLGACAADKPVPAAAAPVDPAPQLQGGKAELDTLLADWWELELKNSPVLATSIGDLRYDDQLVDTYAAEFRAADLAREEAFLQRIQGIDRAKLSGQDVLSYDIFRRDREEAIAATRFPSWMLPVAQFGN